MAPFIVNHKLIPVPGNDEVGALIKTYNALAAALIEMADEYTAATAKLRGLIASVAQASKSLAAAADEAAASATASTAAVAQIAQSMQTVSSGATDQAGQIADTATAVEELSRTAEQIATVAASQAQGIAQTTTELGKLNDGIGALTSQGTILYCVGSRSIRGRFGRQCRSRGNRRHHHAAENNFGQSDRCDGAA